MALARGALSLGHSARAVAAWLAGEAGITPAIADGITRLAHRELKLRRRAEAIDKHGTLFAARVDAGIAAARGRKTR
jgi:hypothetical protein